MKRYLIAGLLVWVPLGITIWVLHFLLSTLDQTLLLLPENWRPEHLLGVHVPGLAPAHDLDFMRTFNDGTALPSLDILDAVGTYDQSNLSVFNWTVGRFGNPGAEYTYETITISVVPAPATAVVLALVSVIGRRRRESGSDGCCLQARVAVD